VGPRLRGSGERRDHVRVPPCTNTGHADALLNSGTKAAPTISRNRHKAAELLIAAKILSPYLSS
jgi:hypothetical protein